MNFIVSLDPDSVKSVNMLLVKVRNCTYADLLKVKVVYPVVKLTKRFSSLSMVSHEYSTCGLSIIEVHI